VYVLSASGVVFNKLRVTVKHVAIGRGVVAVAVAIISVVNSLCEYCRRDEGGD
jgi:hypothetical protein